MNSKIIAFVCIQLVVFNVVSSCGCSNILPVETILSPSQVIFNPGNQYVINPPNPYIINPYSVPSPCVNPSPIVLNPNPVVVNQVPNVVETVTVPGSTTIIQDNSVANNLANALQLLIVSNLLSDVLPYGGIDVLPPCAASVEVFPGYPSVEVLSTYGGVDLVSPYLPSAYISAPIVSPAPCGCGCNYLF